MRNETKIGQIKPGDVQNAESQKIAANKTVSLKNDEEQEVELFVEGQDLVDLDFFSVSDPMCTLHARECNKQLATWERIGETEVINNNLNPKWITNFSVRFIFNRNKELWF